MTSTPTATDALLQPDEPSAFEVLETGERFPCLIVCDHASRRIPRGLNGLGLDETARRSHLAWDIGAGEVSRELAALLTIPAVLCNYSRLVVDCNRSLEDPTAFLHYGDGVPIHGNAAITPEERRRRTDAIYWPYHRAIAAAIETIERRVERACVISVHSFTPVLDGVRRDWDAGVLWDRDPRLAMPVLEALSDGGRWKVGDNEPYSGRSAADFTIDYHAEAAGRPHLALEIRQDHLATREQARDWAARLASALSPLLGDERLYAPPADGGSAAGTRQAASCVSTDYNNDDQ